MPKRGAVAIVTTVIALILLLSFKTPTDAVPSTGLNGSAATIDRSATGPSATATPRPPGRPPGGAPGDDGQGDDGAVGVAPTPRPAATPAPSGTPNSGVASTAGTYDGPVVDTQFGPVQVRVTIKGGTIVDVQALQLPFDRRRSAQISQYVEPILRSSVLAAQSTRVDLISGATYTSDAYLQSLQAALDAAHT